MKKVIILHPAHWEQAMGGAELQISYLAKALKERQFDVHFIYEDKGQAVSNKLGLTLHPLKKIRLRKSFGQRWFLYKKRIAKKFDEIKPDIIYTRFYSSWSGFAAEYASDHGAIHIWALASDNDLTRLQNKVSISRPFDSIEKRKVITAFRKATCILTQNKLQQQLLSENYQRDGIRINQMAETCPEPDIKKGKNPILIAWIGNLKQLKRPELFIQLARQFSSNNQIEFFMAGRTSKAYAGLIDEARELPNFTYLGEIQNHEVNKLLGKAHILVNTSEYEGFSNTFVQAWMRKVVVLSMHSNPDGIITEEEIGFICPSVELLKNKIEFLVNKPEVLIQKSENAYHYAVAHHSVEKNIIKVISLMQ